MRKRIIFFSFVLFTLNSFAQLTDWDWRREVRFDNSSMTDSLINSPIFFLLDGATLNAAGKIKADYSDLRLSIDCDGDSLLNHWIENNEASDSVVVWVNYPDTILPDSNITLFAFYGNTAAGSVENFDLTFPNQLIITEDGDLPDAVNVDWFEVAAGVTVTGATAEIIYEINAARVKVDGTINLNGLGIQQDFAAPAAADPSNGDDGFGGGGGGHGGNGGGGSSLGNGGGGPGAGGAAVGTNNGFNVDLGGPGGNGFINDGAGGTANVSGGASGGSVFVSGLLVNINNANLVGVAGEAAVGAIIGFNLNGDPVESAAGGGAGGGVLIAATKVIVSGTLNVAGGAGGTTTQTEGAGGGGAGGRVKLFGQQISVSGNITVAGGAGGTGGGTGTPGSVGTNFSGNNTFTASADAVTVIETPNGLNFTDAMAPNYSICRGEDLSFTVSENFDVYNFYFDTNLVYSGPNNAIWTDTLSKDFDVHVISTSGICINGSDTVAVDVKSGPLAIFNEAGFNFTYEFMNQSLDATAYDWDFGDGSTSNDTNPTHMYTAEGDFTVCLIARNPNLECTSSDTCTDITVICNFPQPGFTTQKNGLRVKFFDLSDFATSYSWDFGDGGTSTLRSPEHDFPGPGTYNVTLTVSNECGDNSVTTPVVVDCNMQAEFVFQPDSNSLHVNFTDLTPGALTSSWDFGDGVTTSGPQTTSHTYISGGTYNVCLTSTSNCGSNVSCEIITISCNKPQVSYTFTVQDTLATFDGTVSGHEGQFLWNFGDDSTSTEEDPVHAYVEQGIYNVCLSAENSCGRVVDCKQVDARCDDPVNYFYFVKNDYTYSFIDTSRNTVEWFWELGEDDFSTEQNPVKTFRDDTTRRYFVCLTAINICGDRERKCVDFLVEEKEEEDPEPVSISETIVAGVKLFPNPTSDQLYITADEDLAEFSLYNLTGTEIRTEVIRGSEAEINLSDFVPGVYILQLRTANGSTGIYKIDKR